MLLLFFVVAVASSSLYGKASERERERKKVVNKSRSKSINRAKLKYDVINHTVIKCYI